jgi:hypothetical protein
VVSFADVVREVLSDFTPQERARLLNDVSSSSRPERFTVSPDVKVSCRFGGVCTSPSRRDQKKGQAWLCGSNHSHNDRLAGCVAYCRFEGCLRVGQSGNRRFSK